MLLERFKRMGGRLDLTELRRFNNENLGPTTENDLAIDSKRLDKLRRKIVNIRTEDQVKHQLTQSFSGKVADGVTCDSGSCSVQLQEEKVWFSGKSWRSSDRGRIRRHGGNTTLKNNDFKCYIEGQRKKERIMHLP